MRNDIPDDNAYIALPLPTTTLAEGEDYPFDKLSHEYRALGCPVIEKIHANELTPLVFYRDFVAKNIPVLIEGAIDHWPALRRWRSDAYLRQVVGNETVTIDFTPDGRGDSIVDETMFVTPCEEKMKFGDFLSLVERESSKPTPSPPPRGFEANCLPDSVVDDREVSMSELAKVDPAAVRITTQPFVPQDPDTVRKRHYGVPYCQHQNSSFSTEFQALHGDAELHLKFATEAFGAMPDAVNFWMGDTRSVTTMHSDNYENLYAVVCGEKHFTLVPPTDYYWLTKSTLPRGYWQRTTGEDDPVPEGSNNTTAETKDDSKPLRIVKDGFVACPVDEKDPFNETTTWINVDVDNPTQEDTIQKGVQFDKITKFNITVRPGQVLYLPALWFHAVRQRGRTIAINFWYDMAYDGRWVMNEFMKSVADRYHATAAQRAAESEERLRRVHELRDKFEKAHGIHRKTIEEEIEEERKAEEERARARRHAKGIYSDSEDEGEDAGSSNKPQTRKQAESLEQKEGCQQSKQSTDPDTLD